MSELPPDDWGMRARREQSKAHPLAREIIETMLPQLVIVLVTKLGGEITIPASTIDATGNRNLSMGFDPQAKTFAFKVERKGVPVARPTVVSPPEAG